MSDLLEADPQMLVWWGTPIECISALARLERERALNHREVGMAEARLQTLSRVWHEVQPHTRVRSRAERLLRLHVLRAADALQLAAAIETSTRAPIEFVCLDRRLGEAASREGLLLTETE